MQTKTSTVSRYIVAKLKLDNCSLTSRLKAVLRSGLAYLLESRHSVFMYSHSRYYISPNLDDSDDVIVISSNVSSRFQLIWDTNHKLFVIIFVI